MNGLKFYSNVVADTTAANWSLSLFASIQPAMIVNRKSFCFLLLFLLDNNGRTKALQNAKNVGWLAFPYWISDLWSVNQLIRCKPRFYWFRVKCSEPNSMAIILGLVAAVVDRRFVVTNSLRRNFFELMHNWMQTADVSRSICIVRPVRVRCTRSSRRWYVHRASFGRKDADIV